MVQTLEQLELPTPTYNALERIARQQGYTPLQLIEGWIEQYQVGETVSALQTEYQLLIEKDLAHTLTAEEEKRLDAVCDELNAWEAHSPIETAWQERAAEIEAQFQQIQDQINALPERKAGA